MPSLGPGTYGAQMARSARRALEQEAAAEVHALQEAASRLSPPDGEIGQLTQAVHVHRLHVTGWGGLSGCLAAIDVLGPLPLYTYAAALGKTTLNFHSQGFVSDILANVYLMLAILTLPWLLVIWVVRNTRVGGLSVRHRLTVRTAKAVLLCVELLDTAPTARPPLLRRLDRWCRLIERDVLRAHRTVGTMARSSPRHAVSRQHSAHVAGVLRHDLVGLDSDQDAALQKLGCTLLTMGERYAEGRVSAMLPEDALRDAVPVSVTRETLRLSVRLSLAALAALAAVSAVQPLLPYLGVPETLRPWCSAVAAFIPALLIAGPRQVLAFLGVMP
jgi:hypothetical protein